MNVQFPSLYKSTLAEFVQNQELIYKLHESFPEHLDQLDEELGTDTVHRRSSWMLEGSSISSDISDVASKKEDVVSTTQKVPLSGHHKRLRSDSNAMFVLKNSHLQVNDEPQVIKARHKRAPTCPADLFKRSSLVTYKTDETESLTDTECTVTVDNNTSSWTTCIVSKDIILKELPKRKTHLHCYDAFVSFSKNELNIDGSFRMIKRLSQSNLIDISNIRQMASKKTIKELRMTALLHQFYLPSLYISIAYTIGGFMFTIGECNLGFTPSMIQNIYLTGSSLYFFGMNGICYKRVAWLFTQ